jgi:dUTP pyrophosphatase
MKLQVKLLHKDAKMPTFAHGLDAGMDLYAVEAYSIPAGGRMQVATGIAIAVPPGYVGLVWDKSGISHKGGLKTLGGVIDAGYRGEILVGVVNLGTVSYEVEKGAKIAQMLLQAVAHPEIEVVDELSLTERGEDGFGSSGI